MRRLIILLVLIVSTSAASADDRGTVGIGLIVGQPTGLTAEFPLSENTAIDAALGINVFESNRAYLHVEFLYFLPTLIDGGSVSLDAYLGLGAYVSDHKNVGFGLRAPFGLSLMFTAAPLELFAEAGLLLRLIDDVDLDIGGAAGFRYYF